MNKQIKTAIERLYSISLDRAKNTGNEYWEGKADAYRNVLISFEEPIKVTIGEPKEAEGVFGEMIKDFNPKSSLWHDVSEEPDEMKELLCEWESPDATWHEVAFYHANTKDFWNYTTKVKGVTRWAYIDDLFNITTKEPTSEGLEEAAKQYVKDCVALKFPSRDGKLKESDIIAAVRYGANWQKERFEKNRLEHCDNITDVQYDLESEFVSCHIEKNNRPPTYLDAIEYGMKLKKEQIMQCAVEASVNCYEASGDLAYVEFVADIPMSQFKKTDKAKVMILKDESNNK